MSNSSIIHRTKLDPGDGRTITSQITIKVWSDGALSVEGPIEDTAWCLAALDNAKDAIRNHRSRKQIIVPPNDVSIASPIHPMNLKGGE